MYLGSRQVGQVSVEFEAILVSIVSLRTARATHGETVSKIQNKNNNKKRERRKEKPIN